MSKFIASVFYVATFWETFPWNDELSVLYCCQQSLLMQYKKKVFEEGTKVDMKSGECVIGVMVSSVEQKAINC